MKLELGKIVATRGVLDLIGWADGTDAGKVLRPYLDRHLSGDWGLVDDEDKQTNDEAVEYGNRVVSAYELGGTRIWIITEADRSYTTILLPEEY